MKPEDSAHPNSYLRWLAECSLFLSRTKHPFSIHLFLTHNREMPAVGKLLTLVYISASHSKPKNWKASRAKARAKEGVDILITLAAR